MKAEYCVDYLSYKWKTDDLIQTYRETRKHLIVNKDRHEEYKLKRLQNALWREMARNCTSNLSQSNGLIDPSSVSWQKESDITWLYGPIYTITNHETQTDTTSTSSCIQGIKPVLKKHISVQQHSPLPTCSDDMLMIDYDDYYHYSSSTTSNNTSLVSSRNNSFSSISTNTTTATTHKMVYFNPEIIEIEYQPEYPVSITPTLFPLIEEEQEDELWSSLLIYVQRNHSTLNLFILLLKSFFSITTTWLLYQRLSRLWAMKKQKKFL